MTSKDIENDVTTYGKVFGTEAVAAGSVASIEKELAQFGSASSGPAPRKAVTLFRATGGPLGSYGNQSMPNVQFGLLGLHNIFADVNKRYFEPSTEEVVKLNPDVIEVLTYPENPGERTPTLSDLKAIPGMSTVTAVKNGDV